jgi:hypothetical protein
MLRHNDSLPPDQRVDAPDWSNREWNEMLAEGFLFPHTIPPIGTSCVKYPGAFYRPGIPPQGASGIGNPLSELKLRDRTSKCNPLTLSHGQFHNQCKSSNQLSPPTTTTAADATSVATIATSAAGPLPGPSARSNTLPTTGGSTL